MKQILRNQRGVALMMILTAIIILTAIYGQFTFDSKISRIRATNILDRTQAKLLAESGLQLAMTRLRLYKEAYNKVESNPDAKRMVPPNLLNQLWEVPYIYPIPLDKNASVILRDTVGKFQEESLLHGEMKVTIQNISGRLNINLLRTDVSRLKFDDEGNLIPPESSTIYDMGNEKEDEVSMDRALYQLLKRLVDEKKEKDDAFADRYGNLNYQELFTNLKYYTSDYQTMANDPMIGEAEANFQRIPLIPKYGPLSSASELYAIPGWTDELIELIQNEFSAYPSMQIDLNKITANMLRLMFPRLSDDDVKEFFQYRDNPEDPQEMNSVADLKKYFVEQERIMSSEDFDARIQAFTKSGITFGSNPNLFKIVSVGEHNRASYTLVAYVVLPPQEQTQTQQNPDSNSRDNNQKQSTQLLDPRIIEIQVN